MASSQQPIWTQYLIKLPALPRGFHLISSQVEAQLGELSSVAVGMLNVFIQHTSASLTLNENADPDVRLDMEMALNHIAPERLPYVHTMEGPDDMPAHVKSSLLGSSVWIPVRAGQLALGNWQGIYLCEHRDHATPRRLVATLLGQSR